MAEDQPLGYLLHRLTTALRTGRDGDRAGTAGSALPAIHLHADPVAVPGQVQRRAREGRHGLAAGDEHGGARPSGPRAGHAGPRRSRGPLTARRADPARARHCSSAPTPGIRAAEDRVLAPLNEHDQARIPADTRRPRLGVRPSAPAAGSTDRRAPRPLAHTAASSRPGAPSARAASSIRAPAPGWRAGRTESSDPSASYVSAIAVADREAVEFVGDLEALRVIHRHRPECVHGRQLVGLEVNDVVVLAGGRVAVCVDVRAVGRRHPLAGWRRGRSSSPRHA